MRLVNLLPIAISLADSENRLIETIPSSGHAQITTTPGPVVENSGIPVVLQERRLRDFVIGLPEPQEDVLYIVNPFIAAICDDRSDLVVAGIGSQADVVRLRNSHTHAIKTLIKIIK